MITALNLSSIGSPVSIHSNLDFCNVIGEVSVAPIVDRWWQAIPSIAAKFRFGDDIFANIGSAEILLWEFVTRISSVSRVSK